MSTLFASLPRHLYCHVERSFIEAKHVGPANDASPFLPCSWFGLTSVPGRAWGLTVLLESGAVYSHLPPNAIAFQPPAPTQIERGWAIEYAQIWDCFGYDFALHEYTQLEGRAVECRWSRDKEIGGEYLFTAQHYGDAYSLVPEQAKQYHFIALDNGRLAALPANHVLFYDRAFTRVNGWPKGLKRQTERYTCENE